MACEFAIECLKPNWISIIYISEKNFLYLFDDFIWFFFIFYLIFFHDFISNHLLAIDCGFSRRVSSVSTIIFFLFFLEYIFSFYFNKWLLFFRIIIWLFHFFKKYFRIIVIPSVSSSSLLCHLSSWIVPVPIRKEWENWPAIFARIDKIQESSVFCFFLNFTSIIVFYLSAQLVT